MRLECLLHDFLKQSQNSVSTLTWKEAPDHSGGPDRASLGSPERGGSPHSPESANFTRPSRVQTIQTGAQYPWEPRLPCGSSLSDRVTLGQSLTHLGFFTCGLEIIILPRFMVD